MIVTEHLINSDDDLLMLERKYKINSEETEQINFFPSILILIQDINECKVFKVNPELITKYNKQIDDNWD
jgi:hypothetical protein